nr:hypothetical protein Iba_chr02aCG16370 [Ipomoea batatas]
MRNGKLTNSEALASLLKWTKCFIGLGFPNHGICIGTGNRGKTLACKKEKALWVHYKNRAHWAPENLCFAIRAGNVQCGQVERAETSGSTITEGPSGSTFYLSGCSGNLSTGACCYRMKFVVPSLTKGLSSSLYPSFECLVGADLGLKGALAVASFYELVYELFHQLLVRALEPQTPCNGAREMEDFFPLEAKQDKTPPSPWSICLPLVPVVPDLASVAVAPLASVAVGGLTLGISPSPKKTAADPHTADKTPQSKGVTNNGVPNKQRTTRIWK